MSMSVRLAAQRRLARRGDWACDTAMMVPKPRVELAGIMVCGDCEGFGVNGRFEMMMRKSRRRLRARRKMWNLRSITKPG
jgi:hypothetical protein